MEEETDMTRLTLEVAKQIPTEDLFYFVWCCYRDIKGVPPLDLSPNDREKMIDLIENDLWARMNRNEGAENGQQGRQENP